jgi:hypothetical protein
LIQGSCVTLPTAWVLRVSEDTSGVMKSLSILCEQSTDQWKPRWEGTLNPTAAPHQAHRDPDSQQSCSGREEGRMGQSPQSSSLRLLYGVPNPLFHSAAVTTMS